MTNIPRPAAADALGHPSVRIASWFAGVAGEAVCVTCGERWLSFPDPGGIPNPESLSAFCDRHRHNPDATNAG
jgi:hypothetical protein